MTDDTPRLISVTERRKRPQTTPIKDGKRLEDTAALAMLSCDKVGEACHELERLLAAVGA